MAPSTYYDTKTRAPSAQRDEVLGPALVALWEDNYRVYGRASCGKPPAALATTSAATRSRG
ncbi:hypothetical protein MMOR_55840 [Mycolicibacterium moriokaense]|uniref:Uncharacterized protein n=1 Tax=Mycolicibacterium moriokaense TaxID=39691 RepID=A0AAD1HFX6_9MYCO|nr:hypothetical protein MMOR_55840 [Mycolicibacterium moriokaense]